MACTLNSEGNGSHDWQFVPSTAKYCPTCNRISCDFVCDCGGLLHREISRGDEKSPETWLSGHMSGDICPMK
jgi:hypothetical protein